MKSIQVVAHRGFSGEYPENTVIAFDEALKLEVDMIELDIHLSRDHELIIIHDATVDRTSNGNGSVGNMTLSEIKRLDAGSWMDTRFKGVSFLTLEEALNQISRKTRLNVHIKAYDHDRDIVTPLVVKQLEASGVLTSGFIASDETTLRLARQIQPEISICNLSTTPYESYIDRSLAIGCTILQPGNAMVDASFVKNAHAHHLEVNPFYADDKAEMKRLIACGVDGVLTNYPDRLYEVLDEGD
jgi:glycerophosphoryl diester phosphodiesterase|tara:strand:- start:340 stop:1068 length:729 start_codon:yes stop_codon:yes gene_type:complete